MREFMENKLLLAIVIIGSLLVALCGIPVWFLKYPLALKLFVSLFAVGGSVFVALLGFYFFRRIEMKHETRVFDALEGRHHYTILNKRDMAELHKYGMICTEIGCEDSYYIVTEEEWNEHFIEENDETKE